ncbi:MAG TPA: LLM class flavin-dependent oxidoreductase [Ktedonobacteraceae bacterium]
MTPIYFFNLCPFHTDSFGMGTVRPAQNYLEEVKQHAIWADERGLRGIVIYNFHSSLDPLLTAQYVLSVTKQLRPMVAAQPAYMHPYALARAVATLTYMYQRALDLNMVAGASPADSRKIGDEVNEQEKHERLREYIRVLQLLVAGPTTFHGHYFHFNDVTLQPLLTSPYQPELYIPGSSPASCITVQEFAHSSLLMAKPIDLMQEEILRLQGNCTTLRHGMIVGIIARSTDEEAWQVAHSLSGQQDRRTRLLNRMFIAQASSQQHRLNIELADKQVLFDDVLWYGNAKIGIDAPKLVGSYQKVQAALQRYIAMGMSNILLDLPHDLAEYDHLFRVIEPFLHS